MQVRHGGAQPLQVAAGAQDEAHHEVVVGRGGHEDVLEFAAARGHVVGVQAQVGDEVGQHRQGRLDGGHVQWAGAQVDAAPGAIEDPQGGAGGGPGHRHLRLVAEAGGGARRWHLPQVGRDVLGQEGGDTGLLGGQLVGYRQGQVGAGAAGAGVVEGAGRRGCCGHRHVPSRWCARGRPWVGPRQARPGPGRLRAMSGAACRTRTDDLLFTRQLLYQLS